MSQGPTIPLRLISMRLPDTMDWIRKPRSTPVEEKGNVLHLLPGQPSEIVLEIENEGSQMLQWTLEMTGNFPKAWCSPSPGRPDRTLIDRTSIDPTIIDPTTIAQDISLDLTDRDSIPAHLPQHYEQSDRIGPGDRHSQSIYVRVPADFFEAQSALVQQPTLTLDYRGAIYLFAHEAEPVEEAQELSEMQSGVQSGVTPDRRRLVGYQSFEIQIRPASTYMTLLPEIFQTEDFMVRFLSIFEQTFDPSLQTLGSLWAYLDPLTAPRSMLPFLSKWVAWDLNPRWTLQQQRRLMRYAVELYRWRGTRKGLRYYLHLYTDLRLDEERPDGEDVPESEKQISVTDDTRDAFVFGEAAFGEGMMMGGGQPFHFKVVLRPDSAVEYEALDEALIHRVIEQVKPAFCTYTLTIVHPSPPPPDEQEQEPEAIALQV